MVKTFDEIHALRRVRKQARRVANALSQYGVAAPAAADLKSAETSLTIMEGQKLVELVKGMDVGVIIQNAAKIAYLAKRS